MNTSWLGIPIWKCPFDLWVYQELLHDQRPGLVIETGTAWGG
ncbi:MAG: CmcI family methyltransferase, partial [Acidimicrobiales bacterium]